MKTTITAVVAALLLALSAAGVAQTTAGAAGAADASEGEISRTTIEVSNEVMSPFCPGKTLAMCPSPAAAEVRRDIQEMAEEGVEKEEIKRRLIEEYGDEFKIIQPTGSDNALIMAMVGAGLLLCIGVVLFISRRRERTEEIDDRGVEPALATTVGEPDPDKVSEDGDVDDPYLSALRDEYRS